jgi:Do/DeqQ family serine protease
MKARHGLGTAMLAVLLLGSAGCDVLDRARAEPRSDAQLELERQLGGQVPMELDTASAVRLSGAFRGAAATALDAVVQIAVTSRGVMRPPPAPFHDFIPEDGRERLMQGNGSGFIIDERGHILTNHHVIENAVDIRVTLVDGREFAAELVGSDPNSDIAVIRIEGDALPVATMGDSDQLKVGDWVLALGSPLGLRFSVTAGIVSATGRNVGILTNPAGTDLEAFIQTDAAINPGNSGGPLVDLKGRVIGINSAIQTQTGYFAGAGFAIPINLARKFAEDLIEYGVVHRPRLGVTISPVTDADAEIYKLPRVAGVELTSVTPGEAADRAGLRMGDVILRINGDLVDGVSELQARIAQFHPGEEIEITAARYGELLTTKVRLGEFEAEPRPRTSGQLQRGALGFSVTAVPAEFAAAIGRPGEREVPVIQDVDPLGPAAEAGLGPGLVILQVNGQRVRTVAEVRRATARLGSGDLVSLVIMDPNRPPSTPTIFNYRIR